MAYLGYILLIGALAAIFGECQSNQIEKNEGNLQHFLFPWNKSIEEKVTFYLYTRAIDQPDIITVDEDSIRTSSFDVNKDTKIIIHGFFDNKNRPMPQSIKNNFLETSDVNVIIVDWGKIAIGLDYAYIARQTPEVGHYVGRLVDSLVRRGTSLDRFHLIGHSLGAHIAGFAGASLPSGKVARITGLDPAKPQFESATVEGRLDETDAEFVDCIHTCAGLLGLKQPLGHVDFYPNGGKNIQPGCHIYDIGRCSHVRAHEYFAESILPDHVFPALACFNAFEPCIDTNVTMGNYVSERTRGIYYVTTNSKSPFATVQTKGSNGAFKK